MFIAVAAVALLTGAFVAPASAVDSSTRPSEAAASEPIEPDPSGLMPGDPVGEPVTPETVRSGDVAKQIYNARRDGDTVRVELPVAVLESANRFEFTLNDALLGAIEAGTTSGNVLETTDGVATIAFPAPAAVPGETVQATVAGTRVFLQVLDSRAVLGYTDTGDVNIILPKTRVAGTFTVNGTYVAGWNDQTGIYNSLYIEQLADVAAFVPLDQPYLAGTANVLRVLDTSSQAVVFESVAAKPELRTLTTSTRYIANPQEVTFTGADFSGITDQVRADLLGVGTVSFQVVQAEAQQMTVNVDSVDGRFRIFTIFRNVSQIARASATYDPDLALVDIDPKSVLFPGSRVDFIGEKLETVSEVLFDGIPGGALTFDANVRTLSVDMPTLTTSGRVDIEFVTPTGRFTLPAAIINGADRVSGSDRFATAVELSKQNFSNASTVFLTNGLGFADALSAGAAAANQNAPLLLTTPGSLPQVVADEIVRLAPTRVIIAGGTAAVNASIESAVQQVVPSATVDRIAGTDRYDTSRKIAEHIFGTSEHAYLATGASFPDALSAVTAAARFAAPVMLVNGNAQVADADTLDTLQTLNVSKIRIAGGTAAVSSGIESSLRGTFGTVLRIAGSDRYATSLALVQDANDETSGITAIAWFASGVNFADALAASPVATRVGQFVYLSPTTCVPAATLEFLRSVQAFKATVVGGTNALGASVQAVTSCR